MTLTNSTVSGNGSVDRSAAGRQPGRHAHAAQRHARRQPPRRAGDRPGRHHVGAEHDPRAAATATATTAPASAPARTTSAGLDDRAPITTDLGNNLAEDTPAGRSPAPTIAVDPRLAPTGRQRRSDPDRGAAARQPGDRRRQRRRVPAIRPARRHAGRARTATSAPSRRSSSARRASTTVLRERDRLLRRHARGDDRPRRRGRRAALHVGHLADGADRDDRSSRRPA